MTGNPNMQNEKSKRLEVVAVNNQDDDTCKTFVMHQEDHTLGNALRYVVMKNPEVEFCGYSIPHPSENKINFRIQTKGAPATEVLQKGLQDLNGLCQHVYDTFQTSVSRYKRNQQRAHEESMEMDT